MNAAVASPAPAPQARRIGYVLSLFPCYDETFILREMKGLRDHGVDLTVFSLRERTDRVVHDDAKPFLASTRHAPWMSLGVAAAFARALAREPGAVLGLAAALVAECWRRPATLLKSLAVLPKAARFAEMAKEAGVEHLHAHWATYPSTAALLMSRLGGMSWSFTCHAHDIFLDPSLLEEKLAAAEFVLTCTADNKRHLQTLSAEADRKVRVSYHGLDVEVFQPREDRTAGVPPAVLAVGSLLECKGFDILIAAAALLKAREVPFSLVIAGGGPLEAALKAAVQAAGLADLVSFTGYVSQAQLLPLYRGADLFVLPAVLEMHWGIPNVLVEALACGVPVITTPLPSLPELVDDGVHGLVARNRDPRDVADKMERLLRNGAERQRMGHAGRARVLERFDAVRTIDSVLEPLTGAA